jgi:hypothetical protein
LLLGYRDEAIYLEMTGRRAFDHSIEPQESKERPGIKIELY